MKYISYEAIKKWLTRNIDDLIDITDEEPEVLPFNDSKYPEYTEIDWLDKIDYEQIYDQYTLSKDFKEISDHLFLKIIKDLDIYFNEEGRDLSQIIKQRTRRPNQMNQLIDAIYRYGRAEIIFYYTNQSGYSGNYDSYLLNSHFYVKERTVILNSIRTYLNELPPATKEIIELFDLTSFGTKKLWWDLDGNYRHETTMTEIDQNIMHATKGRNTKIWQRDEKKEILDLYLSYWKIIMDPALNGEPSKSQKRNLLIQKIKQRKVSPEEENRQFNFITSLLVVAENTIRKKHNIRQVKVSHHEENINKRFKKQVLKQIWSLNDEMIEPPKVEEPVTPKKIKLSHVKIKNSQDDLNQVIGMITDFVGEDDSTQLSVDLVSDLIEDTQKEKESVIKQQSSIRVWDESQTSQSKVIHDEFEKHKKQTDNSEDVLYQQFISQLVNKKEILVTDAEMFFADYGLLLNPFINQLNKYLYDLVEDQVVLIENNTIIIDEFYQEEMYDLVKSEFKNI